MPFLADITTTAANPWPEVVSLIAVLAFTLGVLFLHLHRK